MLMGHRRNQKMGSSAWIVLCLWLLSPIVKAQQNPPSTPTYWSLQQCVSYAIKNNISVKQADVQARLAALQQQQAHLWQYPSVNLSTGLGPQFGRSIDPTTNAFSNTALFAQNYSLQGGVQVYNWGKLKHNTAAATFSAQAALADVEKASNDIALNVATGYLQVLSAKEQLLVYQIQVLQTQQQLQLTQKKVIAGTLPELNLIEQEAQLANDSSNLIAAQTAVQQNLIALKALLNLDVATPFDVSVPALSAIKMQPLSDLQPETVYQLALQTQPAQKANAFKIKAAEQNIAVNKANFYPSITGNYSLASTYNNKSVQPASTVSTNLPIGKVTVNATDYTVYAPYTYNVYEKSPYLSQLNNNFRQSIALGISIPVFTNGQNKLAYETAKLNYKSAQLVQEQANQKLKQDVYTAYTNATAALQKYQAATRSVQSAQKAYDAALKRYEVGLLNTLDLITNQNNLSKTKIQALINQFEYIFRMKLLEFYKGEGLIL